MDGQNFNNGFNDEKTVENTPVTEPVVEPAAETVKVETGSYSYQDASANTGSYNYQDNTAQYTAPVYGENSVVEEKKTPGLAIGALVMGIISILFTCCCGGGIVFSIAGLIMSIQSNKKQKCGVGTAALVCSIVGIVLNVISVIYWVVVYGAVLLSEM